MAMLKPGVRASQIVAELRIGATVLGHWRLTIATLGTGSRSFLVSPNGFEPVLLP
jgi:hypothetical protein